MIKIKVGIIPPPKNIVIRKMRLKNFLPTNSFLDNGYAASNVIKTEIAVNASEYRKEVEEAISTKLLESGVEFKTRIGVVTSCHTGPTALGVALMPKFDRFEA